jgi:thioredoxin 1
MVAAHEGESMSDERTIEEIREQKLEQLREGAGGDDAAGATESPAEPRYVNGAAELDDAIERHDVVLVDFYADWCGPCKMLDPILKEVATETDAAVVKVDVDANQMLASEYNVQGIPALVLFAGGEPAQRFVGVQQKETLVGAIQQHS